MPKENAFATIIGNFGKIWLHKRTARYSQITFLILLLQIIVIGISFSHLPPEIPLFFSRPWGKEQLSSPFSLLIFPFISLVVLIVNSLLATLAITADEFLASILAFGSTVFSFFNLIAILKILSRIL